ncbi:MAG: ATP-binding protein [Acidobacteria bacterium]|nr:ATP-binding protein [Acidobacteriota bacterium]MCI0718671.1 ATP-binding protein [Acidobacteriota bacterium]
MKERKETQSSLLKSRPIFKRHLYISSALFAAIILIITFTLFRLSTSSLRDRVDAELTAMAESLALLIREQIQNVNARLGEPGAQNAFQRTTEVESFLESLMAQQEEILYVLVQDLKGEILFKAIRRGMELEQNQFSRILISTRNSRPPRVEVTSLGNPNLVYLDLIEPILLDGQPELIVHFGVDSRMLENRFSGLRASLLRRILIGSAVVVAMLTLALLYVHWLLKRAQLVEAEAHMADRLAYVGTLAGGLAHEIRNPLSAINLNLQMIEEELGGEGAEGAELAALLKGTKQEIKRLDRLAANFLVYAKPLELERKTFDVGQLVDEIILLMQRECENSGIRLEREGNSDAVKVEGDPDLLKQAILNLVVNAQDALMSNPKGPRIIQLAAGKEGDRAFVRVRDNGPGISAEDSRGLFKLFYSGKRGGTGLGLPIAQRIVESHGGRIAWRNHPEGGAEFAIWYNR